MALKTFVKIGGITNLSDARYCSGMYVDLLGFSVEQTSDRYISPTQFSEITGWLSGLEYAGEFETSNSDEIREILQSYPGITWIEHGNLDTLIELKDSGFSLIYRKDLAVIREHENAISDRFSEKEILLHITSQNDFFSIEDQEVISQLSENFKLILGAGLSSENILDLLVQFNLKGIALTGGTEIKPGLKDFDELADILEKLEIEE